MKKEILIEYQKYGKSSLMMFGWIGWNIKLISEDEFFNEFGVKPYTFFKDNKKSVLFFWNCFIRNKLIKSLEILQLITLVYHYKYENTKH